ncbi:hypothetical protein B0A49_07583 [Cryomyces minteri]|uniref:Large ribosomal subunit protein uL23m n=1 Tax=Cryomyces minteri TaxID=331657 RepID=A0A4V5NEF9_9PEZI|nr:hypothetical protein B0A49_07583 [Cryomyces minteri]
MSRKLPFPLGRKEVFLPSFTITLLRTPRLPPRYATFIVPLNLNKLDIRDYLYNVYGITALSVRSYVQQQKVRHDRPDAILPRPRKWFRPRAIKKMTVEMEKPFVWPEEPEDFSLYVEDSEHKKNGLGWDKETFDAARKASRAENELMQPDADQKPSADRETIAAQAQLLLTGKEVWKPKWEDVGEPEEVEKELEFPKI